MVDKKTYRVQIILQEYDSEGFWDIFDYKEIVDGKDNITEHLENIIINCKKYMKKRGLS